MMNYGGDKPNTFRTKVRNAETTVTIKKGGPTFYNMNGTGDGVDAISAVSLPAAKQTMFSGIALQEIGVGKIRETLVHGICDFVRLITASRAASTDVWASYSAGAIGDVLSINSNTDTDGQQALSRVGAASAGIFNAFGLAQTYASATTQASSIGGASLYSVITGKVFVRSL